LTALVWNLTCGCAGLMTLGSRGPNRDMALLVGWASLLQFVSLMVILSAGQAMRRAARNRGLCWAGAVLCLGESVFLSGRGFLLLSALDRGRADEIAVGLNCLSLLLSGGLFLVGMWAMNALNAPTGKPPTFDDD
ncbi:MAG: hypothetical protein ACRC33_31830, partial [Gemmataceae bacterium]